MNDLDLLYIINNPDLYKDKIQEFKDLKEEIENSKIDLDARKFTFKEEQNKLEALKEDIAKLQEDINISKRNLAQERNDLDISMKKFAEHEKYSREKEKILEAKEKELLLNQKDVEEKLIKSSKLYAEGSDLKQKYDMKLNKLKTLISE